MDATADCRDICAASARIDARGGVTVSARTGVANGAAAFARGVGVDTVFFAVGRNRVAFAASLEEGLYGDGGHAYFDGRAGVLVARGAPYDDSLFGFALGVGAAAGARPGTWMPRAISDRFASPFGEARLVLQVPTKTRWHPFVATTGTWVTSLFGEDVQTLTLDAGVAWLGW
jgi:hypothetical protein